MAVTQNQPRTNSLGQKIGWPVDPGRFPRPMPARRPLEGRYCRLEPADPGHHAADLFRAFAEDHDGRIWTYLPYGPFGSETDLRAWMQQTCLDADPMFFVVRRAEDNRCVGVASFLRIDPQAGSIEVGHINFAPALQRTPAATEAMYLMMHHAVQDLGYRRYEWKCDALNDGSRRAADRLGFRYEGTFRQATHYKGRNRDTAWFALTDADWPHLRDAFQSWLSPDNFLADGSQHMRLADVRRRNL